LLALAKKAPSKKSTSRNDLCFIASGLNGYWLNPSAQYPVDGGQ
jgi:hypothetical protein